MENSMNIKNPNIADILFGSFIRYDRLYEMTKYAFYGRNDSNSVNIHIDCYSLLRSLYARGSNFMIKDSYAIASCLINLAIHLRAYFETRHGVTSKVYLIYGGARPKESFQYCQYYNEKNILMEDSNYPLKSLINDNLQVIKILTPYLHDIFYVIDEEAEFSVLSSTIIDMSNDTSTPNIIYSKDPLAYQLVAFKPRTFLYRPKKRIINFNLEDSSWVVTKSTLFNAYRYGELDIKKQFDTNLSVQIFSIYQAIAGVKSRNLKSIKTANNTIKILENAISNNVFSNGYLPNSLLSELNPLNQIFEPETAMEISRRYSAIDLQFQTSLYKNSPRCTEISQGIINLYNPQEVRNINDKYFIDYPLDLNRV